MQTKRSGRAEWRIKHARYGKKSALFRAAALLGALLCVRLVLPARAQSKTEDAFCFPLETTQWRISDGYGWREDPFTGKRAFHKGIDLACAEGTGILAVQGGHRAPHKAKCQLWQLHGASACGWNSGGVCPSAVYLCPSGRSRRGRAAPRHGRAERPGHRGTSAF